MGRLGIGLIGTGKHGVRYAHHLVRDFPELRLVAIARRDEEARHQQEEEFGCRGFGDFRDLVADPEVEAVIVVTPPTLHPPIVEAVANARKPLLLEKPAAATLADGLRLLQMTRQAGIPVMVAQTLRFNGVTLALRTARERIGRLHSIRLGQRFEPSRPGWIDDASISGGGMTLHTGIHCFDLVRWLSGLEVDRAFCEIGHVGPVRTEDNFAVTLRLGGGAALATIAGSRATRSRSGGIELAGEDGQLHGDHVLHLASEVHGTTVTPIELPPPTATVRETIAAFADALRSGSPMPIPLEEGLRAVAIVEACYRSVTSGRAETVPVID